MALRSTTGCYTCKSRRKKCDETHPRCHRCIKSGIACGGYEFVNSKDGKLRTKPAPKPPRNVPSAGQTSISVYNYSPSLTSSASTSRAQLERLDPNNIAQNHRTLPLPLVFLTESCDHRGTNWGLSQEVLPNTRQNSRAVQPALPIDNPMVQHEAPFQSYFPRPTTTAELLNPDQTSLYRALLSPEHLRSNLLPPDCSQQPPEPEPGDEDEGDYPEGVQQVWISTPTLDHSVASNLFPFVLQSYANWMALIAFDPSQSAYGTKNLVIQQLADSEGARRRVKFISQTMRTICDTGPANPKAIESVSMLVSGVHKTVLAYLTRPPELIPDLDQRNASKVLDNVLEILGLQIRSHPLSSCLALLEFIAPIFRRACPEPSNTLVNLCDILLGPEMNLRHFVTRDVGFGVGSARPLLFRYNVEFSIEICDRMKSQDRNFGLQWLHGIPGQFIVLLAWMSQLKEDSETSGHPVSEETVAQIERDLTDLNILMGEIQSDDPARYIGRLVVQECWRQAVYVYLYMGLCGANSRYHRVVKAHKAFMRLVNGVKPGRRPDAFLTVPWFMIGVATTEQRDQNTLRSRLYALQECVNPGTCGNDGIRMLEDIWKRTAEEGRPAVWNDKRIACYRVCGM